jgi:hypothetical protein
MNNQMKMLLFLSHETHSQSITITTTITITITIICNHDINIKSLIFFVLLLLYWGTVLALCALQELCVKIFCVCLWCVVCGVWCVVCGMWYVL